MYLRCSSNIHKVALHSTPGHASEAYSVRCHPRFYLPEHILQDSILHHLPYQDTYPMTMSKSPYKVVEPHPQVSTPFIHTARGGAGNVVEAKSTTQGPDATGPASRHPTLNSRKRTVYTSGRGGAGNLHHISERAIFSFDEELEQQMKQMQDLAPVCHVGRGGAGNRAKVNLPLHPFQPGLESDTESTKSGDSTASTDTQSGIDTINKKLRRSWGKMFDAW